MIISEEGLLITARFFYAIEVLTHRRKLRGLNTFARAYNINYWNLTTLKNFPKEHALKPEWLSFLVTDYGVSADYLLTGRGMMFLENEEAEKKSAALTSGRPR